MKNNESSINDLIEFVDSSPSMFNATQNLANKLITNGFDVLRENERWKLKKGGKYFLTRNSSSLIAFEIGSKPVENGFHIIGTHIDSPCFKLKPSKSVITQDGYVKLNVEAYGGVIFSSWFDRPLSLAGRVFYNNDGKIQEAVVDLKKPLLIIPNLCIHFNREINTGYKYNAQIDMQPLFAISNGSDISNSDCVKELLAMHLNIDNSRIIDYDLFLYACEKSQTIGLNDEFISAPRLDNLWSSHAAVTAIIESQAFDGIKVFAAFDSEEIGNTTGEGAASIILPRILNRICKCLEMNDEDINITFANSFVLSSDCAHAVHPNHADKHDPINRPKMGNGLTIKYSSSQRFSTNARTAATFAKMCDDNNVPYQRFANRSDIVGGSTLGPTLAANTAISTLDVGIALLAMHSVRELGSVADNSHAINAFKIFYSSNA